MSYTRYDWITSKRVLQHFQPSLSLVPNDTSAARKAVCDTLSAFLFRDLSRANNDELANALVDWRKEAIELFGKEQYHAIQSHKRLFQDHDSYAKDTRTATLRFLLSEFGYPTLAHTQNFEELIRQYEPEALRWIADQEKQIEKQHAIEQESERVSTRIHEEEAHILTADDEETARNTIEKTMQDIDNMIDKRKELNYKLAQLMTKQRRRRTISQHPTYQELQPRLDKGVVLGRALYYLRSKPDADKLYGWYLLMKEFNETDIDEQFRAVNAELEILNKQIQAANDVVEDARKKLERHQGAQNALPNLRLRQEAIDNGDDVIEISAAQALSERLRKEADEKENARIKDRRRQFEEWRERRAHNKDESEAILADSIRFAQSKDSIEKYFDDYPIKHDRIQQTLANLRPNTRVDVSNFNNDEREILKPELIKKITELFTSIPATSTVQIRFGRKGGDIRFAPTIRTKHDAFQWLNNWVGNTLMIDFNEETHLQLTDGDRQTVADLWTVDWFEVVVRGIEGREYEGNSALSMGYSKYYFKRQGVPIVINGKEYEEDLIVQLLRRYQIADHIPMLDDTDILVPCFIHAILLLNWTPAEKKRVSDLLRSRIKRRHISGPDTAALCEELSINAIIHNHDKHETVEYTYNGRRYQYVDGQRSSCTYASQEKLLFGEKKSTDHKCRNKIVMDVLKHHCMIHDDDVLAGLSSWELIQTLLQMNRLQKMSLFDTFIFNEILPTHDADALNSYYMTCWKTPKQVLNYHGHFYEKRRQQKIAMKKLKLDSPELLTTTFDEFNAPLAGYSILLNFMIDKGIDCLADSGTVKDFLSKSTRGALVSIADNKHQLPHEATTILDINSFYWLCLAEVDVPIGLPRCIHSKMNINDILKLVNDDAIVFVRCEYDYVKQTNLDRKRDDLQVLTSYDIKSGNYSIHADSSLSGFYWSKEKILRKAFKPLVSKLFEMKQTNKTLKRVLNAGIGRLIKKWKPYHMCPYKANTSHSNPSFLGFYNASQQEKWADSVDFTYCFHTLHSLILSYASFYLQTILFKHCHDNNIDIFYTSTDSIAIRTRQLPLMKAFMGNGLGQLKVEASSDDDGAIFLAKGLYYVSPEKYCCRGCSHQQVEAYCDLQGITLKQLFNKLLHESVIITVNGSQKYTLYA